MTNPFRELWSLRIFVDAVNADKDKAIRREQAAQEIRKSRFSIRMARLAKTEWSAEFEQRMRNRLIMARSAMAQ